MKQAPDFLIVGAARAGTTALAAHLAMHSNISFTDPKETHFLALGHTPQQFAGPGDRETINCKRIRDHRGWIALMQSAGPGLLGEGSVSSLYYHENSIEAIRRWCPDARIVIQLRPPVERAMSAHAYLVSRGYETLSFDGALSAEDERVASGYHHLWHYRRMSMYAESVGAFIDAFGRQRILVLDYQDFGADPSTSVRRVQEFLGLDHEGLKIDPDLRINASGGSGGLVTMAQKILRSNDPTRRLVKKCVPFPVRERLRAIGREVVEADVSEHHRDLFAADLARLRDVLGSDAPKWTTR